MKSGGIKQQASAEIIEELRSKFPKVDDAHQFYVENVVPVMQMLEEYFAAAQLSTALYNGLLKLAEMGLSRTFTIIFQQHSQHIGKILPLTTPILGIQKKTRSWSTNIWNAFVESGNPQLVQLALEKKVDFTKNDAFQGTALHQAASHGHVEIMKLLLTPERKERKVREAGAVTGKRFIDVRSGYKTYSGHSLGETALYVAASKGNVEAVKVLCEAKADTQIINQRSQQTALHACLSAPFYWNPIPPENKKAIFDLLFQAPLLKPEPRNSEGRTYLHSAVENASPFCIVERLVTAGADVSAVDKDGNSVFHLATGLPWNENLEQTFIFLHRKDPQLFAKTNAQGKTALELAIERKNPDTIAFLVKLHIEQARNQGQITPGFLSALQKMALRSDTAVVNFREIFNCLDRSITEKILQEVWYQVVMSDNAELVELFLDLKVQFWQSMDTYFKTTIVHEAAQWGRHITALEVFKKRGVLEFIPLGESIPLIDQADAEGNTPILTALSNDKMDVVKLLQEAKANVDCVNNRGETLLHIAINPCTRSWEDHREQMFLFFYPKLSPVLRRSLLEHPDEQGQTLFLYAASHGAPVGVFRCICEGEEKIDFSQQQTPEGSNVFHELAKNGQVKVETLEYLYTKMPQIADDTNAQGLTALQLALFPQKYCLYNTTLAEFLLEKNPLRALKKLPNGDDLLKHVRSKNDKDMTGIIINALEKIVKGDFASEAQQVAKEMLQLKEVSAAQATSSDPAKIVETIPLADDSVIKVSGLRGCTARLDFSAKALVVMYDRGCSPVAKAGAEADEGKRAETSTSMLTTSQRI